MPTRRGPRQPNERADGRITRHEAAIRKLLEGDERIHRNGFRNAVTKLWAEIQATIGGDPDPVPVLDFVPDAYVIDHERKTVILFEVEDWSPIRPDKALKLGLFWAAWDDDDRHDWLPRLFVVNRYGRVSHEIPMAGLYLDVIQHTVEEHQRLLEHVD